MPRSVVVGIVSLFVLSLLGLAGIAIGIADVVTNGIWSGGVVATGLHVPARAISVLTTWLFALAWFAPLKASR